MATIPGNSMRAASPIVAALTNTEIISMRFNPSEVPSAKANMIGFVFPVYHWTMPEAVVRFIKGLMINPSAYIFAVSTPGFINGHSFEVLDGILKEKNTSIRNVVTHFGWRLEIIFKTLKSIFHIFNFYIFVASLSSDILGSINSKLSVGNLPPLFFKSSNESYLSNLYFASISLTSFLLLSGNLLEKAGNIS